MGGDRAANASARTPGPATGGRVPRGDQRGALSGPFGLRVAHAASPLRALADGLRLVPRVGAAVRRDHPTIRRSEGLRSPARRWVVERTFGWMTRWRRLVRDYEARIDVSQAMILVAMGGNLLRRTTHP